MPNKTEKNKTPVVKYKCTCCFLLHNIVGSTIFLVFPWFFPYKASSAHLPAPHPQIRLPSEDIPHEAQHDPTEGPCDEGDGEAQPSGDRVAVEEIALNFRLQKACHFGNLDMKCLLLIGSVVNWKFAKIVVFLVYIYIYIFFLIRESLHFFFFVNWFSWFFRKGLAE